MDMRQRQYLLQVFLPQLFDFFVLFLDEFQIVFVQLQLLQRLDLDIWERQTDPKTEGIYDTQGRTDNSDGYG